MREEKGGMGKEEKTFKRTDLILIAKFRGFFFHENKTKHYTTNMSNMNEHKFCNRCQNDNASSIFRNIFIGHILLILSSCQ